MGNWKFLFAIVLPFLTRLSWADSKIRCYRAGADPIEVSLKARFPHDVAIVGDTSFVCSACKAGSQKPMTKVFFDPSDLNGTPVLSLAPDSSFMTFKNAKYECKEVSEEPIKDVDHTDLGFASAKTRL